MTQQKREADLDALRVVAIIAVIAIHCLAWVQMTKPIDSSAWMIGNILDSAVRWCVPVFVMISGALLIRQKTSEDPRAFFKKRLNRILVAIIAWPIIYTIWPIIMFDGTFMPTKILLGYLAGTPVQIHLYFLFLIAGLYLLAPVISLYASKVSIRTFRITTLIILIATTASHSIETFLPGHGVSLNFLTQCLPYVGYFMLGFALKDIKIKNFAIPLLVFVSGTAFIALCTYFLSHHYAVDGTGSFFYTYPSPLVMITSTAFFIFFRALYGRLMPRIKETARIKTESFILTLSGITFGVYLIHIIVLETFETVLHLNPSILKQSLLLIVLTTIGSFASVFVLTKLPVVRYILR